MQFQPRLQNWLTSWPGTCYKFRHMLKYFWGTRTYKDILGVRAITKIWNHCSKERVGGRKGICYVIKMQVSTVATANRE